MFGGLRRDGFGRGEVGRKNAFEQDGMEGCGLGDELKLWNFWGWTSRRVIQPNPRSATPVSGPLGNFCPSSKTKVLILASVWYNARNCFHNVFI